VLLIIFLAGILSHPRFATSQNLINIARQISVLLIVSVGQTFVILVGGIDISVGSVISFISVIVVAMLLTIHPIFSVLIGLSLGLIIGAVNGFIVTKFKIMPFLVTFCAYIIYAGLALFVDRGACRNVTEPQFINFFSTYIFGVIPISIFYAITTFLIGALLLSRSIFGIKIYAVGGNKEAARLAGINVNIITLLAYAISGLCAALAANILSGILKMADALVGIGYEFDSIAVVCIGGTLLTGGEGSIIGTLGGALIIGVIKNLFNLYGVSPFVQQIATGLIILTAVLLAQKKS